MVAVLRRVAVAIVTVLDLLVVWKVPHEGDWYQFWYAGHLVVTGRSPYDAAAWEEAARQAPIVGSAVNIVRLNCEGPEPAACLWRYPPWTALVYAPFGSLPADAGITLLALATIAAAAAAVVLLVRRYAPDGSQRILSAVIVLAAQPLVLATRTGHLDPALLIGALLVLAGLRGRTVPLIAGALILSLKPHLFIAFGLVVVLVLARRRRWRHILVTTAALAAVAVATSVTYPPPLASLVDDARSRASFDVPTIWALRDVGTYGWPLVTLLLVTAFVCALLAVRWSPPGDEALVAGALALSLVLAPYEQSYDHTLLLPAVVLAICAASGAPAGAARAAGLLGVAVVAVIYPWWAYFDDIVVRTQEASALVPVLTIGALAALSGVRRRTAATVRVPAMTTRPSP